MCECLRGKEHRRGRFCCCTSTIGLHFTGLISAALMVLYFILLIRSSENDQFNWMVLVWIVLIGMPRVIFWFVSCNDTIVHRRNYAFALAFTTCIEFIILVANTLIIFIHDQSYCTRVYAVEYMVDDWDITCDWAITIYEICTFILVLYYFYASSSSFDHYWISYHIPRLEAKEVERLKIKKEEAKMANSLYAPKDNGNSGAKKQKAPDAVSGMDTNSQATATQPLIGAQQPMMMQPQPIMAMGTNGQLM